MLSVHLLLRLLRALLARDQLPSIWVLVDTLLLTFAKGQKYFDSGDYQMAKQKPRPGAPGRMMIPVLAQPPTGDTIPTPDTVPARKTSIIQPLHDHSQSMHQAADPAHAGISSLLPPPVTPGQPMPNPAITKLAL